MSALSFAGTAAMFLVGGGIIVHGIPPLHHTVDRLGETSAAFGWVFTFLADVAIGIAAGALVLAAVRGVQRLLRPRTAYKEKLHRKEYKEAATALRAKIKDGREKAREDFPREPSGLNHFFCFTSNLCCVARYSSDWYTFVPSTLSCGLS